MNGRYWRFSVLQLRVWKGVDVIEQASPEGDHAANGLAEVGVREVKAQTRVLKRQLDWSESLATWLVRHSAICLSRYRIQTDGKTPDQRRTGKRWRRQAVEFGERAAFQPVAARRERRVAGDAERLMDGIFVGHHERTGASLFLSERGLLRGTRVQRKTADPQWDNEFIRRCRGVPWMLIGEEPEVRPPPVPAVVMPIPEAIRQNATTDAQVHSETGCGAVRTDARMRGLYSSGRRST